MLEQLVECENRLLEEQRRFNELLLAYQSGDLGDDLTRMKIEQMQREVDALGRQLTALRTVIAAQADRERRSREIRQRRRRDTGRRPGSRIWKKRSAGRFCRFAPQD